MSRAVSQYDCPGVTSTLLASTKPNQDIPCVPYQTIQTPSNHATPILLLVIASCTIAECDYCESPSLWYVLVGCACILSAPSPPAYLVMSCPVCLIPQTPVMLMFSSPVSCPRYALIHILDVVVIFVNFLLTCIWWCGNHGGNDNVSETTLEPVEGRIRFPAFKYQITKYQIPSNKGCTIMCLYLILHCQRPLPFR